MSLEPSEPAPSGISNHRDQWVALEALAERIEMGMAASTSEEARDIDLLLAKAEQLYQALQFPLALAIERRPIDDQAGALAPPGGSQPEPTVETLTLRVRAALQKALTNELTGSRHVYLANALDYWTLRDQLRFAPSVERTIQVAIERRVATEVARMVPELVGKAALQFSRIVQRLRRQVMLLGGATLVVVLVALVTVWQLAASVVRLQGRVGEVQSRAEGLATDMKAAQGSQHELNEQVKSLQGKLQEFDKGLRGTKDELPKLKTSLDEALAQIRAIDDVIQKVVGKIDDATLKKLIAQQTKAYANGIDKLRNDAAALDDRVGTLERATSDLDAMRGSLRGLRTDVDGKASALSPTQVAALTQVGSLPADSWEAMREAPRLELIGILWEMTQRCSADPSIELCHKLWRRAFALAAPGSPPKIPIPSPFDAQIASFDADMNQCADGSCAARDALVARIQEFPKLAYLLFESGL